MKFYKTTSIDFSELFQEAKKRLKWDWNKCCEIFHSGEIICSPENKNYCNIYLDDTDYYKKKALEGDEKAMGYKLIHDIMKENNIKKLRIINS